jgi:alpha-tubulin suppressor-like RCC1 family protein
MDAERVASPTVSDVMTVEDRGWAVAALVVVLGLLVACFASASTALATTPAAGSGTLSAVAWGQNVDGELGAGYKGTESNVPASVLLSGFRSVVPGYYSTYAPMSDGTVRAWGGNNFGELGNGTRLESDKPVRVKGLSGVVQFAAGGAHSLARLGTGGIATWGGNTFGTIGNGTSGAGVEAGVDLPVFLALSHVVSVAAGGSMDAAVLSNGTVMTWGENKQGQLGDGTTIEKNVPTPVRGLSGVKAMAVGGVGSLGGHMLALRGDGTVMAWGGNEEGQLGDGTMEGRSVPVHVKGLAGVVAISAGPTHSLALLADGTLMAWGSNTFGQLGIRGIANSATPRPVLRGVTDISAGLRYSLAVKDCKAFAWGWNHFGVLGDGTNVDKATPVPVLGEAVSVKAGEYHSAAIIRGAGPPPVLTNTPGKGSITVNWRGREEPSWLVLWRKATQPRSAWEFSQKLPTTARSYTVRGLAAGRSYEVGVEAVAFGEKIVTATPLP